jgi:dihydropteroate synthase
MRQELISRVIHFSSTSQFQKFKQKYSISDRDFSIGQLAIEVQNLSEELLNTDFSQIAPNYSDKNDRLFLNYYMTKDNLENLSKDKKSVVTDSIISAINKFENYDLTSYRFGNNLFSFDKIYTMGILNVTPDSFSDGGKNFNSKDAINAALKMIDSGCDFIDIGGESSRPGAKQVDVKEELLRVAPVIMEIKKIRPGSVISVDTIKSEVARGVLQLGADIINDISGLTDDKNMINTIIEFDAGVIIMHMKGTPQNMQNNPEYDDVVSEVYSFLFQQSKLAEESGISKIFIDPGIGFGKNLEHNLELINQLDNFKSIGYPIVFGISRKSLFKKLLNLEIDDRENATSVYNTVAILKGAKIIRTHNIEFGMQTCKLLNSLNKKLNV